MEATPDRYAPPQAHVEDVETASGPGSVLAGRGRRLGAVIIDGIIGFALFGLIAWLTPWNPWTAAMKGNQITTVAVNLALGYIGFIVIHGWLLLNRGQTLGKAALGVRIVRPDGSRATALQLLGLRYGLSSLFGMIPFVGGLYTLVDSLFIFRASRRCIHDVLAGTIVVNA
jgi:uncharacterized RDD family membrane protein YckC